MPISATKNKMTINTYKILFVPADVKKIVPSTCSLHSAVRQSLLVLPAFPQERGFLPSYLIFSFYNKDNSSSTHAVL